MQAAAPGHEFVAGTQVQMIGVAQNDLRADGVKIVGSKRLHAAHRAHGHEDGGFNDAVRGVKQAGSGVAVPAQKFEGAGGFIHECLDRMLECEIPAQQEDERCGAAERDFQRAGKAVMMP